MAALPRSRVIPILPQPADGTARRGGHDEDGCTGAEVFALRVMGVSMAPEFADGDIVVIEPGGAVQDGSYVLAELPREGWVLRQLVRSPGGGPAKPPDEGDGWWLQVLDASSPAWPLASLQDLAGVVIQRARPGRRKETRWYTA